MSLRNSGLNGVVEGTAVAIETVAPQTDPIVASLITIPTFLPDNIAILCEA